MTFPSEPKHLKVSAMTGSLAKAAGTDPFLPDAFDALEILVPSAADVARLRNVWGREPLLLKSSDAARTLVSRRDIEVWINTQDLRPPNIALLIDGKPVPHSRFSGGYKSYGRQQDRGVDPQRVRQMLGQGATLQLHPVDLCHEPTTRLTRTLASAMRTRVHVVAFLTPPGEYGRRVHVDDVHVFAIQVAGCKTWEIRESADDEQTPVVQQVVLSPGDMYYVPPGLAHCARSGSQDSLHISITIGEPSPREVAAVWIRDFLASVTLLDRITGNRAQRLIMVRHWLDMMARSLSAADAEEVLRAVEKEWIEPDSDWVDLE